MGVNSAGNWESFRLGALEGLGGYVKGRDFGRQNNPPPFCLVSCPWFFHFSGPQSRNNSVTNLDLLLTLCSEPFTEFASLSPIQPHGGKDWYSPHFTDGEAETHTDAMAYARSHRHRGKGDACEPTVSLARSLCS